MSPHGLGDGCLLTFLWPCPWERPIVPGQASAQQLPRARRPGSPERAMLQSTLGGLPGGGAGLPPGPRERGPGALHRQEEQRSPRPCPERPLCARHWASLADRKLAFECGVGWPHENTGQGIEQSWGTHGGPLGKERWGRGLHARTGETKLGV